ncbi:MAG: hypothetical protein ABII82_05945 [Verrucomicrobiota bacterium]
MHSILFPDDQYKADAYAAARVAEYEARRAEERGEPIDREAMLRIARAEIFEVRVLRLIFGKDWLEGLQGAR